MLAVYPQVETYPREGSVSVIYLKFQQRRLEKVVRDLLDSATEGLDALRFKGAWNLDESTRLQAASIHLRTARRLMDGEPE